MKEASHLLTPVSQRLVDLIERNADELTKQYLQEVKRNIKLPSYRGFDENEIYKRAFRVYSQLGKWISQEFTREDFKNYWWELGRARRREGIPLSEIILSLCILRNHLWLKVEADGLLDTALDLFQALELNNRVILFFDKAIYHTTCGYEDKD